MQIETGEEVTIGYDSAHSVKGIGTCTIKLKSGNSIQLSGVLYVPGIKRNLISISALEDDGFRIAFMGGKVLPCPKNSTIKRALTIGVRQGLLYELCAKTNLALVHETSDSNEIWHRKLGHINFGALTSMEKVVTGMPKLNHIHNESCKGCALGKNTKKPYPHSLSKTKEVLELVHSDLCGPMSIPSIGGFLYYLIFVDDFSRKTWIYFHKCKEFEEILSKFKEFKTITENSSGKNIKVLRTNNGKEYTSEIFKEFCKLIGIKREFTVPYNPQ